jgi:hypothetical protein
MTSATAEANFTGRWEDAITFNGRENVKAFAYIADRYVCEPIDCKLCNVCVSFFTESGVKGCDGVDRK